MSNIYSFWNTNSIKGAMDSALKALDPKYDVNESEVYFDVAEKASDNTTPKGTFVYKRYTMFGWLKVTAISIGQKDLTVGNKVSIEYSLKDRVFLTLDSTGEIEKSFDFDLDGFTLQFCIALTDAILDWRRDG